MKRIYLFLLTVLFALCSLFALSACDDDENNGFNNIPTTEMTYDEVNNKYFGVVVLLSDNGSLKEINSYSLLNVEFTKFNEAILFNVEFNYVQLYSATVYAPVFTLPQNFCPIADITFPIPLTYDYNHTTNLLYIAISSDGTVSVKGSASSLSYDQTIFYYGYVASV